MHYVHLIIPRKCRFEHSTLLVKNTSVFLSHLYINKLLDNFWTIVIIDRIEGIRPLRVSMIENLFSIVLLHLDYFRPFFNLFSSLCKEIWKCPNNIQYFSPFVNKKLPNLEIISIQLNSIHIHITFFIFTIKVYFLHEL